MVDGQSVEVVEQRSNKFHTLFRSLPALKREKKTKVDGEVRRLLIRVSLKCCCL